MEQDRLDGILSSTNMHIETQWSSVQEAQVLEPYTYLLANPGKDIRSTLIHAFNAWLKVDEQSLGIVLQVVEMLHTASLLIDDVEDGSELRRGKKAAHLVYGQASTINSANYIYFSAMALLRKTKSEHVTTIFEEEILNLHRGQGLELYWRDRCGQDKNFTCPSEAEYISMVNNKTGGLLRMAIRLMQALSPDCARDYVPLANTVGILFQIRDDYMNLASTQYCKEKGFCEDLTEGKYSFPIIHGISQSTKQSRRLKEILLLKTDDVPLKSEACEIMRKQGSLGYTIQVVAQLDAHCRRDIALLGSNSGLLRILDRLKIDGDGSEISETLAFVQGQHEAKAKVEALVQGLGKGMNGNTHSLNGSCLPIQSILV